MTQEQKISRLQAQWNNWGSTQFGRWLVTKMVCFTAPYFRSIKPLFEEVKPGYVSATMKKRWSVTNHIKSVHAIAMCNIAELVGGCCMDVSVNLSRFRWIPIGMEIQYIKIAKTDLRAVCRLDNFDWDKPQDVIMPVEVYDTNGQKVFHADIKMRISDKK